MKWLVKRDDAGNFIYACPEDHHYISNFIGEISDHKRFAKLLWGITIEKERLNAYAAQIYNKNKKYQEFVPQEILDEYDIKCIHTEIL